MPHFVLSDKPYPLFSLREEVSTGNLFPIFIDCIEHDHERLEMSLRRRFLNVLDRGNKKTLYSIIYGWYNLPNALPDRMFILCNDKNSFANEFGLDSKDRSDKNNMLFEAEDYECKFYLIDKGAGLFSEPFEADIIARSVDYNGSYIPRLDQRSLIYIALATRYDKKILGTVEVSVTLNEFMKQQVGIGRGIHLPSFFSESLKP